MSNNHPGVPSHKDVREDHDWAIQKMNHIKDQYIPIGITLRSWR